MKPNVEQVEAAVRELRTRHAREPSAAGAFELARLLYATGDYDEALERFMEARDRAPAEPSCALALARAASALGEHRIELDALVRAERDCPPFAGVALHRALLDVPRDPRAAMRALALPR